MLPIYVLARDHLQCAAAILQGTDQKSQQLRSIIERTIGLMEDYIPQPSLRSGNVVELSDYRRPRL